MDNDPDLIAACTKVIPQSARADRTKRKKKKRGRPLSTFMSILHKINPSKSKKPEPSVTEGASTSEADSCRTFVSERHMPPGTRLFKQESMSGASGYTSSAACESSSCVTRESVSMASVQDLASMTNPTSEDQERIDRTQNLVDAVSIQTSLRSGLSSSWSYLIQDPLNGQSEKALSESNEAENNRGNDVSFNESYFEDDYCEDFSDPDVFLSRSDAKATPTKSENSIRRKGDASARNQYARRSKNSKKKRASASKQSPASLPIIVVTPPSQTPESPFIQYDNIEDYFSFSFEKVKTGKEKFKSKSREQRKQSPEECGTPSRVKVDRKLQFSGKSLFGPQKKRKHPRESGSETAVSSTTHCEYSQKEIHAEKKKSTSSSHLKSPMSEVPKIKQRIRSTESAGSSRLGLRNRRLSHKNKLGELRVPSSYRDRVESGYVSNVNPLTPSTPASPGVNSTRSPTLEEWTISSALSSLGNGTTTRVLNRLDGLTTPCGPTRGFNASPRFKFPPVKKRADLKVVSESRESSPNLSVVGVSPETSEGHVSHVEVFKDEDILEGNKRRQSGLANGSATDSGNGTFTSRGNSPTVAVDENNNYIQQPVSGAALQNTAAEEEERIVLPSLTIPLPILTSSPVKENTRTPMEIDSIKQSHTLKRGRRKSNTFTKGKMFKKTKRMLFEKGESGKKSRSIKKKLDQNLNQNLNLKRNCMEQVSSLRDVSNIGSSMDYLLLKRTADFIVHRITIYDNVKKYIQMARLVEYLHNFYHRILARPGFESARTVTGLRGFHAERLDIFRVERLTAETCMEELLISSLLNKSDTAASCTEFIFKNVSNVVAVNPDFLTAAPEVVLMLLSHKNCPVLNAQGFPLPYKESEREVLDAALKYFDYNNTRRGHVQRHLKKMLSLVSDPRIQMEKDDRNLSSSSSDFPDDEVELTQGIRLEKNYLRRPFHEINFYQSETYVTAHNSRQEYLFQPFLSTRPGSGRRRGRRRRRSECDLELNDKDGDHDEDDDGNNSAASSIWNDLSEVCDGVHVLQKLYFSYRHHNQVPYITHVALQYSTRGRKRTVRLGRPNLRPASNGRDTSRSHGCNVSADTPSGFRGSPTKTVEVKLAPGEHIIGLAVQGDAVLHNVEIHTSRHRHIRAHVLPEVTNTPWITIPPPPHEGPFCLHAMFGDVRGTPERPYIRGFGVVWAVMSLAMNNLSA